MSFAGPETDCPTLTHQELTAELIAGNRWTVKWAWDITHETEKAVCFREVDEYGRTYSFWVPKSACDPVNYVAPSGLMSGAFVFPTKFLRRHGWGGEIVH